KKSQKWDEMNILATYHPAGKDYGLMKIEEPSTPYHRLAGDEEEGSVSDSESYEPLTADDLVKKLAAAEGSQPKIFMKEDDEDSEEDDDDEEEEELSPEEQAKKKQFEMKRKMHYNEGLNIKLAKQLIARELEEDDEDEDQDEEMKDETEVDNAHMDLPQDASPASTDHTSLHGRQLKCLNESNSEPDLEMEECSDSFFRYSADYSREIPPGPDDINSGSDPFDITSRPELMGEDPSNSGSFEVTSYTGLLKPSPFL
ncbi:IPP2 inhibitor, partial [Polypterus senegalus]